LANSFLFRWALLCSTYCSAILHILQFTS
jgi:hypothetical protein